MKRGKPARERKENLLRIRLTADQWKALDEAARRENLGLSLSGWARQVLLREARKSSAE